MSFFTRITRGETEIPFTGQSKRWFGISAVLIVISLAALGVRGLNLGVEFTGGVVATVENLNGVSVADLTDAIRAVGVDDVTVQAIDDGVSLRIQTPDVGAETEAGMLDVITTEAGVQPGDLESVGPTFGALVAQRSLQALGVFLGAVALFITWRLEFKMAIAGLVALLHDLTIAVGVYAITGLPVTPATVVALLTILGYSLYDTVVVFDKVDELVTVESRAPYSAIVDRAMNLVLGRSIATSFTSLLPVGSILFIGAFVLGATSLRAFALALFVGITAGTFSSIFLAGPLLAVWKEREGEWEDRRERYGDTEVTADITDVLRARERAEREKARQGPPTLTGETGRQSRR